MRRLARSAVERLFELAPPRTRAGDRLVLSYHNVVAAKSEQVGDRSLHLLAHDFSQQLDLLVRESAVVPLTELLTVPNDTHSRVAITFDDVYAGALEHGVKQCVARGLPCTIFVAPALLGRVPLWDRRAATGRWTAHDRSEFLATQRGIDSDFQVAAPAALDAQRISTEAELAAVALLPGVSIGNHTMMHANLAALDAAAVAAQINDAAEWFAEHLPVEALPIVAYPYGHSPKDLMALGERTAVSHAFRVNGGWMGALGPEGDGARERALNLPRWNVPAGISRRGFRVRLRGFLAH